MPPAFVNIGAWIGGGSLVDSNVTVGLGAQVGEEVRISSGSQIGGFIEPLEKLPTIICDKVLIGGNCGIYDGVFVSAGAILTAGTILTGQTRLYDAVHTRLYMAKDGQPLVVPPGAIVVPGSRRVTGGTAKDLGILINVPVVVGYRDGDGIPPDLLGPLLGN